MESNARFGHISFNYSKNEKLKKKNFKKKSNEAFCIQYIFFNEIVSITR
jgi:hypothetical protein